MCILFHSWSQWADTGKGKLNEGGATIGQFVCQERRCQVCGKVQLRMAKGRL